MKRIIYFIVLLIGISLVSAWDVTITATNQVESIVFGVDESASAGYDADFDTYIDVPLQNKVIMSIDDIYAKNYLGLSDKPKWNVKVGVPTGQTSEVEWTLNEFPSDINLFMTYNSNEINMKNQNKLELAEEGHELIIEATLTDLVINEPTSSTSSKKTSSSGFGQTLVNEKNNEGYVEPRNQEDTFLESKSNSEDTIPKDIGSNKEETSGDLDLKNKNVDGTGSLNHFFTGLLIMFSIVVIGLLMFFSISKFRK